MYVYFAKKKATKFYKLKTDNVVCKISFLENKWKGKNAIKYMYIATKKRMVGTRIAEHIADIN